MERKEKIEVNQKIRLLFYATPVVVLLTIFLIYWIFNVSFFSDNDSTNWGTSIIEMGIGTSITIAILIYSNNQQRRSEEQQEKITELVSNIQNIEKQHYERERKRLMVFSQRIISNLESTRQYHFALKNWLTDYLNNDTEENKQNIILSSRRNWETIEHFFIPHIKNDLGYIGELFQDPLLSKNIINQCNSYGTMLKDVQENFDWKNDTVLMKISAIDKQIDILITTIDGIKKEVMEPLEP
jgi:hypothetical protein